MLKIRIYKFIN